MFIQEYFSFGSIKKVTHGIKLSLQRILNKHNQEKRKMPEKLTRRIYINK